MQENFHQRAHILMAILFVAGVSSPSRAAVPDSGCFDFDSVVAKPLQTAARPPGASGELPNGGNWAATESVIGRPLSEIVGELRTHKVTKSSRAKEMVISPVEDPRYLLRQSVHFEIYPFPFVTVAWDEDWAFLIAEGTKEKPQRVVVVYQKASGTSHISHLCGSYILSRKTDDRTDVSLYEEAKATSRTREDMVNGIKSTLENLSLRR